jgi:hypothetical protein
MVLTSNVLLLQSHIWEVALDKNGEPKWTLGVLTLFVKSAVVKATHLQGLNFITANLTPSTAEEQAVPCFFSFDEH